MLGAVLEIERVDKGGKGVEGKDVTKDFAQFVDPQKRQIEAEEMDMP